MCDRFFGGLGFCSEFRNRVFVHVEMDLLNH